MEAVGFLIFAAGCAVLLIAMAAPKTEACKQHKWARERDGGLRCDVCKRKPGEW